jgi:outer membrane lipoprotein-sorting protein
MTVILCLGGCATAPSAPPVQPQRPPREATLDEALAAYDAFCEETETLSASGDLDVRDRRAGKSRKLGVRVVAARGGRLYLKGSVAVVTALEVVADGDRFWFQVPSRRTVWTGAATAPPPEADGAGDPEGRAPYYALRPGDVTAALLPEPLRPAPGDTVLLEAEREAFVLTLAAAREGRGTVRRKVWLRRETLVPVRLAAYDERGELESVAELGNTPSGSRRVAVHRPREGYDAEFLLGQVVVNQPVPAQVFVPRTPEGYRVVEVP